MPSKRMSGPRLALAGTMVIMIACAAQVAPQKRSFKDDVMPIVKKYCLPCHSEDNYNPSELSLDSYELMMDGGKHGAPIVAGDPDKSLLVQKVMGNAPFGDPMPLAKKLSSGELQQKRLTAEELQILKDWIAQGAQDN